MNETFLKTANVTTYSFHKRRNKIILINAENSNLGNKCGEKTLKLT